MNQLTYIQKFILISALFLLPVVLLGFGLVAEIQRNLAITHVERQGLQMMSNVFRLIREASEYRDRSIILRVNDQKEIRDQLDVQRKKVEHMISEINEIVTLFGDAEIDHQVKQVHVSWKQLNSYSSGAQGGPHIQFKYYDSFVRTIQSLVDVIGYRTKLAHDPNLNTFLLINMLSDDMPIALRELGRSRAYGVYALNQLSVDHDTYLQLDEIYDDLTDSFHLLSNNMGYAVAENQKYRIPLQRGVDRIITGVLQGRDLMYDEIIEADRREMAWQEYYAHLSDIHAGVYDFIDELIGIVVNQLDDRAGEERKKLNAFMALTGVLMLIIIYLYAGMYRSIHDTLKVFVARARSVSGGNLDASMPVETKDEMRELAESFNQMVGQLSQNQKDLVEARKLASLGHLVAGIAHEMNTPLGVSLTAISYLEQQYQHAKTLFDDNKLSTKDFHDLVVANEESMSLIKRNLGKASNLVSTFKMLSVQSEPEKWNRLELKEYLYDLPSRLDLAKELDDRIVISCSDNISLYVDEERLTTLFSVLINNAFTHGYMSDDSGEVIITAKLEGEKVFVSVEDHGRGVDEQLAEQIFDPFVTTTRNQGAAGLGLHIAYNIVSQALFGQIKCVSKLGRFTRFEITMPIDFRETDSK
ncbi:HAMP domain-containing sensor histidine kinase [Litoribacillus peritrichatus]|uniref:histidine kinase n=1 Tax=Litoribacillus peritrichatus TaxID=718191 RepID=A0ABP7M4F2_9GAMM